MPPAAASILSPNANPFVPTMGEYDNESDFKAIYVNGVPELMVVGNHPDHEVIHNISDDAIDEVFPPTATDVAELEAVDEFLRTMVDLSYLEEKEESARNGFSHVKKRWELRRQQGLKGKPAIHGQGDIHRVNHEASLLNPEQMNVVRYGKHLMKTANFNQTSRLREKEVMKNQRMRKSAVGQHGHLKPIQQPRKMN